MHHVFVSHSSADEASTRAVVEALRAADATVWVDFGEDRSATTAGIPAGQPHWATISRAIDECDTFFILWTPDWASSEYCRREYAYATSLGKRIVAVAEPSDASSAQIDLGGPPINIAHDSADAVGLAAQASDALRAHTSIVMATRAKAAARSRFVRLLLGVPQAGNAKVLSAGDVTDGFRITQDQSEYIDEVLVQNRQRGRDISWLLTGLMLVLVVSLVFSVRGERAAVASNSVAQSEKTRSEALRDAQQALELVGRDSAQALEMATRASADYAQVATKSSLSTVTEAASRTRVLPVRVQIPQAVAVSPGADFVVITYRDDGVLVDTKSGDRRTLEALDGVGAVSVDATGRTLAYLAEGALFFLDVDSGKATPWYGPYGATVGAVAFDGKQFLWAADDGFIYSGDGSDEGRSIARSAGHALALQADADGFAVVTSAFVLHRFSPDGQIEWKRRTLPPRLTPPPPSAYKSSLIRCGDKWHGTYEWPNDEALLLDRETSRYWVSNRGASSIAMSTPIRGLACDGLDGSWGEGQLQDWSAPWPSGARWPSGANEEGSNFSVVGMDAQASTAVIVTEDGRLQVRPLGQTSWMSGTSSLRGVLPLSSGLVTIGEDGQVNVVTDGRGSRTIGRIAQGADVASAVSVSDSRAVFAAADVVYEATQDGLRPLAKLPAPVGAQSLQVSQDGNSITLLAGDVPYRLDWTGQLSELDLDLDFLFKAESLLSLAAGDFGYVTGTNLGRIRAFDQRGRVIASADLPSAGPTFVGMTDDTIVTGGSDGTIRTYSAALAPVGVQSVQAPVVSMRVGPDGQVLVGRYGDGSYWLLDAATLETRQWVADRILRTDRVVPDASWDRVVALHSQVHSSPDSASASEGTPRTGAFSARRWTESFDVQTPDELETVRLARIRD